MSIIIQLPNTVPYIIASGLTTKIVGESFQEPAVAPIPEFCYCDYECEYIEKVFGHLTDNDYWKNDKNTFLYRRILSTDTVTIKLLKDEVEIATITDDTYGVYTNGYLSGNAAQQLYVSFIVDWQKVLQIEGGGNYRISTELNLLGVISIEESQKFMLYGYSDLIANGTVRIETRQNGNIIGSAFDFTGLNLYNSYRLQGIFKEGSPELEQEFYLNTDYKKKQIQDQSIPQYTLNTKRVPRIVSLMLQQDSILANEFEVTDYNIINVATFRRVSVYPDSISKVAFDGKNTRDAFDITFKDKFELLRKRNN